MSVPAPSPSPTRRAWRLLIGSPRDVADPHVFHHVSLVAFLAWVGLGADGLSSSCYGPEEAFKALGSHAALAPFVLLLSVATIGIISLAYSHVIEAFPSGGGGYVVASKLLGERVGLVSGAALLVDYVLTITVSVAGGCDQLWSSLPQSWHPMKLPAELAVIVGLVVLNLRGVKESVTTLAPVFLGFLVTHVFLIGVAMLEHAPQLPSVVVGAGHEAATTTSTIGFFAMLLLVLRAYSLGAGTFTGIEAVSNGVASFREPRVRTGRRTMLLMGCSLAFTAGGILLGYLLTHAEPVPGRTLNAVLFTNLVGAWHLGAVPVGHALVVAALVAEAALLFVAAQAGFLDGPRVLANMALDSWVPRRFAQISDRLVAQNGVLLMGLAAIAALLYTRGDIVVLVVMYSINVFVTFTLTLLGMTRHWIGQRGRSPRWKRMLLVHGSGFLMSAGILVVVVVEKLREGGWVTLLVTACAIGACLWVRSHYEDVKRDMKRLDDVLVGPPKDAAPKPVPELDPSAPTAVICVSGFSGFGIHQVLAIHRSFPRTFRNFVFVSAAVVDSGAFKGAEQLAALKEETEAQLDEYVRWCRSHGIAATKRMGFGVEAVSAAREACHEVAGEFPRAVVFLGKLVFEDEKWYHRLLHNDTAHAIQRRLQFDGVQSVVLPIRVLAG